MYYCCGYLFGLVFLGVVVLINAVLFTGVGFIFFVFGVVVGVDVCCGFMCFVGVFWSGVILMWWIGVGNMWWIGVVCTGTFDVSVGAAKSAFFFGFDVFGGVVLLIVLNVCWRVLCVELFVLMSFFSLSWCFFKLDVTFIICFNSVMVVLGEMILFVFLCVFLFMCVVLVLSFVICVL